MIFDGGKYMLDKIVALADYNWFGQVVRGKLLMQSGASDEAISLGSD
jgi:hypothetical protein